MLIMAIVLHAARATHDWWGPGVRRGERMYHVLSDVIGPEGSRELRAFVQGCGLRPEWVQYPGTYREHFDAPPRVLECMLGRGARLVMNRELGTLLATKREALGRAAPQRNDRGMRDDAS
jgi:hypothetical protein